MTRQILKEQLNRAVEDAGFKEVEPQVLPTSDSKFGDYYSTVALKLAKADSSHNSGSIAKKIVAKLPEDEDFFSAEIAPNGFINFKLTNTFLQSQVEKIIGENDDYGRPEIRKEKKEEEKKARVEFVSANPTGPLHIGNARGGPLGDTIANVLEFTGYKVTREYLNNDKGNQVFELGKTLAAKAGFVKVGGDELTYKGEYTDELAQKVKKEIGAVGNLKKDQIIEKAGEIGTEMLHKDILSDTSRMGIKFDSVVNESDLQRNLRSVLKELEKKGLIKTHKDHSVWFVPPDESLGGEGAVVVKSDGNSTYFGADIVYHKEKFKSEANIIVDVFGSNTSGHVPKLHALKRLAWGKGKFFIPVLYQFVRVKRGNEVIRMSKRAGNFVTAREVLDEVGKDAFRFTMLLYDPNTHMDFDLEQAKKRSEENPVYYVQYAHARCSSILKKANSEGFDLNNLSNSKTNLLKTNPELSLIRKLVKFPDLLGDVSDPSIPKPFPVHLLAIYSLRVADELNKFYEKERVIGQKKETTESRLALIKATKVVLRNALQLMGISAPQHMERKDNEPKSP